MVLPVMLLQVAVRLVLVAPPPKSPMRIPLVAEPATTFSVKLTPLTPPPNTNDDPIELVDTFLVIAELRRWKARRELPLPANVLFETVMPDSGLVASVEPNRTPTFWLPVKLLASMVTSVSGLPAWNWSE